MIPSIPAMVECEIVGQRSAISLVDNLRRSLQLRSIRAEVSLRGDVVIVRETA